VTTLGGLFLSPPPGTTAAAALGGAAAASRSRCGGLGSNEGGRCRCLRCEGHFLQAQGLLHLEEGGEGLVPLKVKTDVGEALVEASDEVEDEGLIRDNLAEGAKITGHPLETLAVIRNG